jgi:hypothetical protein
MLDGILSNPNAPYSDSEILLEGLSRLFSLEMPTVMFSLASKTLVGILIAFVFGQKASGLFKN